MQIERYNALLVAVRRSCAELVKGIKGLVVMSADLDQVHTHALLLDPCLHTLSAYLSTLTHRLTHWVDCMHLAHTQSVAACT